MRIKDTRKKNERQQLILDIIKNRQVSSQEELVNALAEHGIRVTQATLSRDIKKLSGNIAVVKTRNGYASGLTYDIDMSHTPEMLGTIAGADTIFLVMSEDVSREKAREVLSRFIPIDK